MQQRKRRASDRAQRARMRSPGRPPVARREDRQQFWAAIAKGLTTEDAGAAAGISSAVAARWFRQSGGMPSVSQVPLSGRYLSLVEREGDRAAARQRQWRTRDCQAPRTRTINDLAGTATECGDPQWLPRLPSHDCPVACRSARSATETCETRRQQGAAAICARPARGGRDEARWYPSGRSGRALDRSASRATPGPALGRVLEPRADRPPDPTRFPR